MQTLQLAFFLVALPALLLSACSSNAAPTIEMAMDGMAMPADLDTATTRLSDVGLFRATISSALDPIPINEMHDWTLHVETADGTPVEDARITVAGGMPQHDHGLPTAPQVTGNLGGGDYQVEGMRFQMTGWWEVTFDIEAGGASDSVTFNLVLE